MSSTHCIKLRLGDILSTFSRCLGLQVLLLVLSKRYRVDHGAHPAGVRRMAVPYRAKDAAAERAEFAHPDVAMMLSILTCAAALLI